MTADDDSAPAAQSLEASRVDQRAVKMQKRRLTSPDAVCASSASACDEVACGAVLWEAVKALEPLPAAFSGAAAPSQWGGGVCAAGTGASKAITLQLVATPALFTRGTLRLDLLSADFPLAVVDLSGLHNVSVDFLALPGSGIVGGGSRNPVLAKLSFSSLKHLWTNGRTTALLSHNGSSSRDQQQGNIIDLRNLPSSTLQPSFSITRTDLSATSISLYFPFAPGAAKFDFSHCSLRGTFDATLYPWASNTVLDVSGNLLAYISYNNQVPEAAVLSALTYDSSYTQLIGTFCGAPVFPALDRFYCKSYVMASSSPGQGSDDEYVLDLLRISKANFDFALHDSLSMLVRDKNGIDTHACEFILANRFVDVVTQPGGDSGQRSGEGYFRNSPSFSFAPGLDKCAPSFKTTIFMRQDKSIVPTLSFQREDALIEFGSGSTLLDPIVVNFTRVPLPPVVYGLCPNFGGGGAALYFSVQFQNIFFDVIVFGDYSHLEARIFDPNPGGAGFRVCAVRYPWVPVVGDIKWRIYNDLFFLQNIDNCLPALVPSSADSAKLVPVVKPWKTMRYPWSQSLQQMVLTLSDSASNTLNLLRFQQAPVWNGTYCNLDVASGRQLTLNVTTTSVSFSISHAGADAAVQNRRCECQNIMTYSTPPFTPNANDVVAFRPFGKWSFAAITECIASQCGFPEARSWGSQSGSSGVYQQDPNVVEGDIMMFSEPQPDGGFPTAQTFKNYSQAVWFSHGRCSATPFTRLQEQQQQQQQQPSPLSQQNLLMCSSSADLGRSQVVFGVSAATGRASMLYLQRGDEYTTMYECGRSLTAADASQFSSGNVTQQQLLDGPTIWTANLGDNESDSTFSSKPHLIRDFLSLYATMQRCFPVYSNVAKLQLPLVSASISVTAASPSRKSQQSAVDASLVVVDSLNNVLSLTTKACSRGLVNTSSSSSSFQVSTSAWKVNACPRVDLSASEARSLVDSGNSAVVETWRPTTSDAAADDNYYFKNVVWRPAAFSSATTAQTGNGATSSSLSSSTALLSAGFRRSGSCFPATDLFLNGDGLLHLENWTDDSAAASAAATGAVVAAAGCYPSCYSEDNSCLQRAPLLLEIAQCMMKQGVSPTRIQFPDDLQQLIDATIAQQQDASNVPIVSIPPALCADDGRLAVNRSAAATSNNNNNSAVSSALLSSVIYFILSFNTTASSTSAVNYNKNSSSDSSSDSERKHAGPRVKFMCDKTGKARILTCLNSDNLPEIDLLGPFTKDNHALGGGTAWTHADGYDLLCTPCTSLIGINNFPILSTTIFLGAIVNMLVILVSNRLIAPRVMPHLIRFRHRLAARFAGETDAAAKGLRGSALRQLRIAQSRRARMLEWDLKQCSRYISWVSEEELELLVSRFTRVIELAAIKDGAVDFSSPSAAKMNVTAEPPDTSNSATTTKSLGAHHKQNTTASALYDPVVTGGTDLSSSVMSASRYASPTEHTSLLSGASRVGDADFEQKTAASTVPATGASAAAAASSCGSGSDHHQAAPLPAGASGVNLKLRNATREAFTSVVRERLMLGTRLPPSRSISDGSVRRFVKLYSACFDEVSSRMSNSADTLNDSDHQNFSLFDDDDDLQHINTNDGENEDETRGAADFEQDAWIEATESAADLREVLRVGNDMSGIMISQDTAEIEEKMARAEEKKKKLQKQQQPTIIKNTNSSEEGIQESLYESHQQNNADDHEDIVSDWTYTSSAKKALSRRRNPGVGAGPLSARAWSSPRMSFHVQVEEGLAAVERDSSLRWNAYRLQRHFLSTSLLKPPQLLIAAQLLIVVAYFIICIISAVNQWQSPYFHEQSQRHTPMNLFSLLYFGFLNSTWCSAILTNRLFFVVFSTETEQRNSAAAASGSSHSMGTLAALEAVTGSRLTDSSKNHNNEGGKSAGITTTTATTTRTQQHQHQRVSIFSFLSLVAHQLVKDMFFVIPAMLLLPALLTHIIPALIVFCPIFLVLALLQLFVAWLVGRLPEVPFVKGQPVLSSGPGLRAFLGLLAARAFSLVAVCILLRTSFTYGMLSSALWGELEWVSTIEEEAASQSLGCSLFAIQQSSIALWQHVGSLFA